VPIFDYFSLNNGVRTITIETPGAGGEPVGDGLFLLDIDGLLEPGVSTGSAEGNSYVDGSSTDETATVTGKVVTMRVLIRYADRAQLRQAWEDWIEFIKVKNFILDTDWVGPYKAQYVSFPLDEDGKANTENYFSGTLNLITEEAY
jgi:hypothetical protein